MKSIPSFITHRGVVILIFIYTCMIMSCSKDGPEEIPLVISSLSPLKGPKTTVVTITGGGFSANAADNIVTLNDFACPVVSASSTELKVTIPPKAGSGKLVVKAHGKTGETPLFTYVYTQSTVTTFAGSTAGDGEKFYSPAGLAI